MKTLFLATAAALTLSVAAPAFANDQLATSLGVDGQGYTTAELIQLKSAVDEGNAARVNALLSRQDSTGAVSATSKNVATDASAQLADTLSVDASQYSLAELAALKAAVAEDDAARINAITSQAAASSADNPSARIQLGQSVGLDAMTNSRADLVNAHKS